MIRTLSIRWSWALVGLLSLPSMLGAEPPEVAEGALVHRHDPALDALVDSAATVEKVATGMGFVEGPVWVPDSQGSYLLFSDIPANKVWRLDGSDRVSAFIDPVTPADSPAGGTGGSNGLALDLEGRVVLCEHGNRRVARLEADGSRTTLAERYQGKRLNSPNDIVYHSSGSAYFTDPTYGVPDTKLRELDWAGIYRLRADGSVDLLSTDLENPNGIGLSPDEKTLYVANSHPTKRLWMAYPVADDGTLGDGRVHFDGSSLEARGVPDGFAVDERGNIWASGPGGIVVIDPSGKHLGTIELPEQPANAGFGGDGSMLYATARTSLYRVPLKVRGLRFPE
jgi:gluconolactonase